MHGATEHDETDIQNGIVKPVLNWANIFFAEHVSEYSSNFTSFLN